VTESGCDECNKKINETGRERVLICTASSRCACTSIRIHKNKIRDAKQMHDQIKLEFTADGVHVLNENKIIFPCGGLECIMNHICAADSDFGHIFQFSA
jgi:hypothetical protein